MNWKTQHAGRMMYGTIECGFDGELYLKPWGTRYYIQVSRDDISQLTSNEFKNLVIHGDVIEDSRRFISIKPEEWNGDYVTGDEVPSLEYRDELGNMVYPTTTIMVSASKIRRVSKDQREFCARLRAEAEAELVRKYTYDLPWLLDWIPTGLHSTRDEGSSRMSLNELRICLKEWAGIDIKQIMSILDAAKTNGEYRLIIGGWEYRVSRPAGRHVPPS